MPSQPQGITSGLRINKTKTEQVNELIIEQMDELTKERMKW